MNINFILPKINHQAFTFRGAETSNKSSNLEKQPKQDSFQMSIGYVNDIHGQVNNMTRILSGLKGDLKVSAGDNDIGDEKNKPVNRAVVKFLNLAGIKATALGNHELDTTQKDFIDTMSDLKGDVLASNLRKEPLENQDEDDLEEYGRADLNSYVKKSIIVNIKGENIGLIGAAPIDLKERLTHPDYHADCIIDEIDDTAKDIQKEVDKFKAQGINKIVLLSHLGNATDKKIVNKINGVDVIIGGHTHELIRDIKEGENLFYSPEGEPIVITEAGKDGKYFGKLNLEFDKDGVITKAQNNLGVTSLYQKNLINQYIFDGIVGKAEVVGSIKKAPLPPKSLVEENPHANFMCDAMKYELDAEIGIWNNAGARNYFHEGAIDTSDIKDIAPFADNVSVANVSEKTLVDMFKTAIEKTYSSQGNKPGLLAVSGLNYTVNPNKGSLEKMNFVDKNGVEHSIDVDDPDDDKFYKVVADSFMMSRGVDYKALAPKEDCIEYPFNKDYVTCEYIKHINKPIEINQTGRIRFEYD